VGLIAAPGHIWPFLVFGKRGTGINARHKLESNPCPSRQTPLAPASSPPTSPSPSPAPSPEAAPHAPSSFEEPEDICAFDAWRAFAMNLKAINHCAATLLGFSLVCGWAANAAPSAEETLDHLPDAVQKTVRAQVGQGRIRSIDTDNQDGEVTYDVEMVGRGGRPRSFTVGPEGQLLDKEVFMNELPAALRKAIKTKAGTAVIGDIDRSYEDAESTYSIEITADGKTRSFTLDEKGKLVDEEVFLPELPQPFQTAVRKETAGATIDEITRSYDDDEISYNVDIVANGKTRTLTFDGDGVLLSSQEDIPLSEVPQAARKQILSYAANGKLIAIQKVTETNTVCFDADIRSDGKLKSYSIAADGKTIDSDEGE